MKSLAVWILMIKLWFSVSFTYSLQEHYSHIMCITTKAMLVTVRESSNLQHSIGQDSKFFEDLVISFAKLELV